MTALKTVIASYGHTRALKSGEVTPRGATLVYEEVSPIVQAFRRMCRGLEFDVSEMSISTYLCARECKLPFTALPVFFTRAFHHGAIQVGPAISSPQDLEGKKVGVRSWTVTTGVWAKEILRARGVDLDRIEWVVVDEEHVEAYEPPANVTPRLGADLGELLAAGEIEGAIGVPKVDAPGVRPLFGPAEHEAWYRETGVYPMNHTLVVKDELLAANPSLGRDLYAAFKTARDAYVAGLTGSTAEADVPLQRQAKLVGDPLPYGIEANRPALEAIAAAAQSQRIVSESAAIEALFAAGAANW